LHDGIIAGGEALPQPSPLTLMDKLDVARTLNEIARYLELSDPNPFRAKAFEKAARAVDDLEGPLGEAALTGVPGIGKATAAIIDELIRTGTSAYLEELRAQYPAGIFELARVPKLGLRKIGQLHSELGIASLDELEAAARAGKLAKLKGFGARTQQQILDGIAFARARESRFLLPIGVEAGELLRAALAAIKEVEDTEVAGSVRRRLEIIEDVHVVVATKSPAEVISAIRDAGIVSNAETSDAGIVRGRVRNEIDAVIHLAHPADFGATLLSTTGNQEFLEAWSARASRNGCDLRDGRLFKHGKHIKTPTEEEAFERAGIVWVEPERRESGEDLQLRKPRALLELAALRGTFHVHTTYSDGRNTLAEMLNAAREQGFDYLGLSDHSKAASYAGGLSEDSLKLQAAELESLRPRVTPMRVFRGTEADILPDGSIDYGLKTLRQFDFVVASVHSRMTMAKDEMTERLLLALDNPCVTFLGHMTGRRLLAREGFTFDYDRIFERAAERGVMIEINGNPNRLDIDWRLIRRALDRGVLFCINPDAHSTREYGALLTGTWVARKAGLSAKQVFNTRSVEEVEEYLVERGRRGVVSG
jgi:DNA polymerase (family X)